jgi:hypothetical protein
MTTWEILRREIATVKEITKNCAVTLKNAKSIYKEGQRSGNGQLVSRNHFLIISTRERLHETEDLKKFLKAERNQLWLQKQNENVKTI